MSDARSGFAEYLRSIVDADGVLPVWQLKEVGRGGSHVVYEHTPSDAHLIKVPHDHLKAPDPKDGEPSEQRLRLEREAQSLTEGYARLYQHFGREWCIPQQAFVLPSESLHEPIRGWRISSYSRESRHLDVTIGCGWVPYIELRLEADRVDRAVYRQMNDALLGKAPPGVSQYEALKRCFQTCRELMAGDATFLALIGTFLERFRAYVNEADEIIDLVGEDNIFAFPEHGGWTLRIGSVLKQQRHSDLLSALSMLRGIGGRGQALPRKQRILLLNGVAVYRLVNALAISAGSGRLMDLQLEADQLEALGSVMVDEG